LRKRYESSDGTLLYSISEVTWQCVSKKHYAVLAFFSYCYLHMIENTSFPSCKQLCAWYCLRFAEFIE
jgi:hypothetical protein